MQREAGMNGSDHPQVVAIPPVIYAGAFGLGLILEGLFRTDVPGSTLRFGLGGLLLLLGFGLMGAALRAFRAAGTHVEVYLPATALVVTGPYRFTRNPIYIGMTMAYLGVGLLTDSLWEIRKIIVDLRPSGLDDLGLVPALRAYAQSHLEEAGVAVQMRARQPGQRLAPEVETAVFRIAQEAMNNVVRHASAHQAAITLEQRNGTIFLQVEDDGDGFDAEMVRAGGTAGGLGLRGMRERASLLGGTLELESRPGAGTKVRAIIPLNGGTNHEPNREP